MARLYLSTVGEGPPLVILHGWGWNSGVWEPLIPELARSFKLFLIDLPGFGKSPLLTAHYEISEISRILLEETPANASWMGWSLGGMIAWFIAIHFPARVSRLITVASSPRFIGAENWPGASVATLEKFSDLLKENYQKTLREFLELQLRGAPQSSEQLASLTRSLPVFTPTIMQALEGGLNILRTLDLRPCLSTMACPSLHIFGHHDTLVPIRVMSLLQPMLSQGKCEMIKRSGHFPFLSQPEIFLSLVKDFLME